MSAEEAIEYARSENIDYIETSALTGSNVDHMFRRISLSVARALPEVAIHLEVSYLPEGWMACFNHTGTAADSGAASGLSVSDISAVLSEEPEVATVMAKQLSPSQSQRTKSPLAAEAASLKQVFLNYWTGEIVTERPVHAAPLSDGILYAARDPDAFGKGDHRGMKERTSSCKTTATFVSNASGSGSGNTSPRSDSRNNSTDMDDYNGLSESRRSMSRSKSDVKTRTCFSCMCSIS